MKPLLIDEVILGQQSAQSLLAKVLARNAALPSGLGSGRENRAPHAWKEPSCLVGADCSLHPGPAKCLRQGSAGPPAAHQSRPWGGQPASASMAWVHGAAVGAEERNLSQSVWKGVGRQASSL